MHFKSLCFVFLLSIYRTNCKPQIDASSECSVIEQGSELPKPCQFPFVYRGQSYDKCIFKDNEGNGQPWCSTKTDPTSNEHIGGGGHYGDCSPDLCPVVHDDDEFVKWKDQNTVGKYLLYIPRISSKN